jgi:hypothetical protein
MVQRSQDARRERRRTAVLDQLDQGMEIHRTLHRQLTGQIAVEASVSQPRTTPRGDVPGRLAAGGCVSVRRVHDYFAAPHAQFLPIADSASRLRRHRHGR